MEFLLDDKPAQEDRSVLSAHATIQFANTVSPWKKKFG